ncbi:hypothetical protein ACI79D_14835 [Geodermatophilus sp. SYSU D00708]
MADGERAKNQLNLRLQLDIDNQLTWGELFDFVTAARNGQSVNREDFVNLVHSQNGDLEGFEVYLASEDIVVREPGAAAPEN